MHGERGQEWALGEISTFEVFCSFEFGFANSASFLTVTTFSQGKTHTFPWIDLTKPFHPTSCPTHEIQCKNNMMATNSTWLTLRLHWICLQPTIHASPRPTETSPPLFRPIFCSRLRQMQRWRYCIGRPCAGLKVEAKLIDGKSSSQMRKVLSFRSVGVTTKMLGALDLMLTVALLGSFIGAIDTVLFSW